MISKGLAVVSQVALFLVLLIVSQGAAAQQFPWYPQIPTVVLSRGPAGFTSSPEGNIFSSPGDVLYSINRDQTLTDFGAHGQEWTLTISWSGPAGSNIFTDQTSDHIVIGQQHHYFSSPPSNQFVGLAIGHFGWSCAAFGGVGIALEWNRHSDTLVNGGCVVPPSGTTEVHAVLRTDIYGCATAIIYSTSWQSLGVLSDCPSIGFGNAWAGVTVAALHGGDPSSYTVTVTTHNNTFFSLDY
jgi:hypothetical protein